MREKYQTQTNLLAVRHLFSVEECLLFMNLVVDDIYLNLFHFELIYSSRLTVVFQTINNPVYPLLTPDTCKAGMYRTQSMLTCESCPVGSQANTAKTQCGE